MKAVQELVVVNKPSNKSIQYSEKGDLSNTNYIYHWTVVVVVMIVGAYFFRKELWNSFNSVTTSSMLSSGGRIVVRKWYVPST